MLRGRDPKMLFFSSKPHSNLAVIVFIAGCSARSRAGVHTWRSIGRQKRTRSSKPSPPIHPRTKSCCSSLQPSLPCLLSSFVIFWFLFLRFLCPRQPTLPHHSPPLQYVEILSLFLRILCRYRVYRFHHTRYLYCVPVRATCTCNCLIVEVFIFTNVHFIHWRSLSEGYGMITTPMTLEMRNPPVYFFGSSQ